MLGWMDDSPKRTAIEKIRAAMRAFEDRYLTALRHSQPKTPIRAAMRAFEDRYGVPPNVARVHQDNSVDVPGVNVVVEHWVNRNNIFVERV